MESNEHSTFVTMSDKDLATRCSDYKKSKFGITYLLKKQHCKELRLRYKCIFNRSPLTVHLNVILRNKYQGPMSYLGEFSMHPKLNRRAADPSWNAVTCKGGIDICRSTS